MNFVGQEKIIDFIKSRSRDTMPRSLLLLGEVGCGKKTVIKIIGEQLQLPVIDITEKCNYEDLCEIQQKPEPAVYSINIDNISIKEQNVILKFIEEPTKSTFIVLYTTNESGVLPTILNRCFVLKFRPYTKYELKQFTDNQNVLEIAKTPGMALAMSDINLEELVGLCVTIITKIGVANIPNILTIADRIAFKGEKDKYNVEVFSLILNNALLDYLQNNKEADKKFYDLYSLIREWDNERKLPTIAQRVLFESYLLKMHTLMHP